MKRKCMKEKPGVSGLKTINKISGFDFKNKIQFW